MLETRPLQGCAGKTMRVQGRTAAICFGCRRYGMHGDGQKWLEPRAALDPVSGTWQCPDRVGSFAYSSAGR